MRALTRTFAVSTVVAALLVPAAEAARPFESIARRVTVPVAGDVTWGLVGLRSQPANPERRSRVGVRLFGAAGLVDFYAAAFPLDYVGPYRHLGERYCRRGCWDTGVIFAVIRRGGSGGAEDSARLNVVVRPARRLDVRSSYERPSGFSSWLAAAATPGPLSPVGESLVTAPIRQAWVVAAPRGRRYRPSRVLSWVPYSLAGITPRKRRPRWYDVPSDFLPSLGIDWPPDWGCRSSSSFTAGPATLTPGTTVRKLRLEFGCARPFARFALRPRSPAVARYLGPETGCRHARSVGAWAIVCDFLLPARAAYEVEYEARNPLQGQTRARDARCADAARAIAGMSDPFPWQAWPKVSFPAPSGC
jgi:hypothetical protein